MKPGSLVVILPFTVREEIKPYVKWLPASNTSDVYVIRELTESLGDNGRAGMSVTFEEGVIGYTPKNGSELTLGIECVKEIQPPEENTANEIVQQAIEEFDIAFV